jgi:pimeloyl-ACP methyl ester carboxylesterase
VGISNIQKNSQPTINEKLENSLKDIYCISGLGADERVFQKLKFQGYQPIHIKWLEPEAGENIANYTQRLTTQIKAEKPILIGLSFGGIIAVEMSKQIAIELSLIHI